MAIFFISASVSTFEKKFIFANWNWSFANEICQDLFYKITLHGNINGKKKIKSDEFKNRIKLVQFAWHIIGKKKEKNYGKQCKNSTRLLHY